MFIFNIFHTMVKINSACIVLDIAGKLGAKKSERRKTFNNKSNSVSNVNFSPLKTFIRHTLAVKHG